MICVTNGILMDRGGLLAVEKSRYESTAECLGSI